MENVLNILNNYDKKNSNDDGISRKSQK